MTVTQIYGVFRIQFPNSSDDTTRGEKANLDKKQKEKGKEGEIETRINPTQIHQTTTVGHKDW